MARATMFATLSAFALLVIATPQTSHACSCPANAKLVAPADGAQAVPLDIAPVLTGHFAESSVQWAAADGTAVPFSSRSGSQQPRACVGAVTELIPAQPLAADTTYVIRVTPSLRRVEPVQEFRFTTGRTKAAQAALPEPSLTLTLVRGRAVYDSCVEELHGCVSVGPHETELTFLAADDAVLGWMLVKGEEVIERGAHPDTACVEARTRDGAGRRSAPVRRCAAELELRADRVSDYDEYRLRCSQGRIVEASPSRAPDASPGTLPAGADAGLEGRMTLPGAETAPRDTSSDAAQDALPSNGSDPSLEGQADRDAAPSADGCAAAPSTRSAHGSAAWLLLGASALALRGRRRRRRA